MIYSHQADTTVYSTDAWPALLTGITLAIHLGALWLLTELDRRSPTTLPKPASRWAVPAGFGAALISGWLWISHDTPPGLGEYGARHLASRVFLPLVLVEAAGMLQGVGGSLYALVLARRHLKDKQQVAPGVICALVAVVSGAAMLGAYPNLSHLLKDTHLPIVAVEGPPVFHLGHARQVTFHLASNENDSGYPTLTWQMQAEPVTLTATQPRRYELPGNAHNKYIYLKSHAVIEAVPESGGPLFPLRIGNSWEYHVTGECSYQSGPGRVVDERHIFVIGENVEKFGMRMYELQRSTDRSKPAYYSLVFEAKGQSYGLTNTNTMVPVAELRPGPEHKCRLGLFEKDDGTCRSGPLDATFQLPGPDQWHEVTGISSSGSVVVSVLTMGLAKPEPFRCEADFKLVRSTAGPEAASPSPP